MGHCDVIKGSRWDGSSNIKREVATIGVDSSSDSWGYKERSMHLICIIIVFKMSTRKTRGIAIKSHSRKVNAIGRTTRSVNSTTIQKQEQSSAVSAKQCSPKKVLYAGYNGNISFWVESGGEHVMYVDM